MSAIDGAAFRVADTGLRAAAGQIEDTAEATVDDFAAAVLINVRRRRARHRGTGKGERMIGIRSTGSGDGRVSRVHAGGRVAPIIAGGSRPHLIRQHGGHPLRVAVSPRGFAAEVRHPGTRADPFVHEGIADTRPQIQSITDTAGAELVAELAHDIGRR